MDIRLQVQQRTLEMFKGLEHLTCEQRLRELGQLSLDERRIGGGAGLIHVCKYMIGGGVASLFFAMAFSDGTRG